MNYRVIFNLKQFWEIDGKIVNLHDEILSGRKTSEWRYATHHWIIRLLSNFSDASKYIEKALAEKLTIIDLTKFLKVKKAWFVVGYPKNNSPRLEADIVGLKYHYYPDDFPQFEIQFTNIKEVKIKTLSEQLK